VAMKKDTIINIIVQIVIEIVNSINVNAFLFWKDFTIY